jgi:cephalosporin-C deacetylase-like acetyl esterase
MHHPPNALGFSLLLAALLALPVAADPPADTSKLAGELRRLDSRTFPADSADARRLATMYPDFVQARVNAAIEREAREFEQVKTKADWQRFREPRLKALRESLGVVMPDPKKLDVRVRDKWTGEGYRVESLAIASPVGVPISANLYVPVPAKESSPGVIVCHGFHTAKEHAELDDLGASWAKMGCLVLVPDLVGHGERRQHDFEVRRPRQDYYSRLVLDVQLGLVGESLMGWMAADVLRGVDLLLSRPEVDPKRIAVLGSVAGGGDVAAVAAALDERIAVVVPFNFGGPEPETAYPLPDNPELRFPIATGHWDPTRRLRGSLRDGFPPWFIVAACAPRGLVYAHEFAWDRDHDPAWKRLEKVYEFYGAADRLAAAHGSGTLFGKPEGTGCGNIGLVHRRDMYAPLRRWLRLPEAEVVARGPDRPPPATRPAEERSVRASALERGDLLVKGQEANLKEQTPRPAHVVLRDQWARRLGIDGRVLEPKASLRGKERLADVTVERLVVETEHGISVPTLLLVPAHAAKQKVPAVLGVSQHGKAAFLRDRSETVAQLLQAGIVVCLPDVRGTGETRPVNDKRGPPVGSYNDVAGRSGGTLLWTQELTLGRLPLGGRLLDVRAVVRYLRDRPDIDPGRVLLWGDSFVQPLRPDLAQVKSFEGLNPHEVSEPLGGLLVVLAALFDERIAAVYARGGLVSFRPQLTRPLLFVPPDVVIPGAVAAGDLGPVLRALAPRPLCLQDIVWADELGGTLRSIRYEQMESEGRIDVGAWLLGQVKRRD